MYDGSTACAEAVVMAKRVTRKTQAILAPGLHPHYSAATQTLASTLDIDITEVTPQIGADASVIDMITDATACVVVQSPNVFGWARLRLRANRARILLSAKAKALVWG